MASLQAEEVVKAPARDREKTRDRTEPGAATARKLKALVEVGAQIVPLTVEQYHQMIKAGILLEGEPVELLDGLLVRKDRSKVGEDPMTVGHEHAFVISILTRLATPVSEAGCCNRIQLPITLPTYGEPEPDAVIARGNPDEYRGRHPGPADLVCAIEVADSSLRHDRTVKQRIYADGGIARYIIINLIDRVIEDYTQPQAGSGRYAALRTLRKGEQLSIETGSGRFDLAVDDLIS
jgi:Uma2 family endonuclease